MNPGDQSRINPVNEQLEGGCLCGALRYRIGAAPLDAGYCHCRLCQRSSGAPVLAWGSVPLASFTYTTGRPTIYQSSAWGQREFCAACGSQILYRELDVADTVEINLAGLDRPEAVVPKSHIWMSSKLPWLEIADDLPRYEREAPGPHPS